MGQPTSQLIPEWHKCEAVILAWPDEQTDWRPWLDDARQTYVSLIEAIHECGAVTLLLCHANNINTAKKAIPPHCNVLILDADYNDTWVRDYAFLTINTDMGPSPVEFVFNGWGQKFDASKDNQINKTVLSSLCSNSMRSLDCVAEAGALEIDEQGHLLSTHLCLSNPKRNGDMSIGEYERIFTDALGAQKVTVLKHGHLEGDDTDGHIDTLVRFAPNNTLVVQSCFNRPDDAHFASLNAMVEECRQSFPTARLIELPLCELYNEENERLPASYANYLICNHQVLVPVYGALEDEEALQQIQRAYPDHVIKAVNCRSLINQFGSLHCITMQVPEGTLKADVISIARQGVSHYAS